jgi:hypothetical protein
VARRRMAFEKDDKLRVLQVQGAANTSLLPMEDQGFDGKAPNYLLYLYVPPSRLSIKLNIAVSNAGFARLGQNDLNIL